MMKRLVAYLFLVLAFFVASAQQENGNRGATEQIDGNQSAHKKNGPPHQPPPFTYQKIFDVILGRPSNNSIDMSLLSYDGNKTVLVEYVQTGQSGVNTSNPMQLRQGEPLTFTLENLRPASAYNYKVTQVGDKAVLMQGRFVTQPTQRSNFQFSVTADSHLDQNSDLMLYQKTLANIKSEHPDFHIDLGDTFMTEKYESRELAAHQYLAQRGYFGQIGNEVPLFLVLGNHDGEETRQMRQGVDSLGVWAAHMRKRYFPNPYASGIYSAGSQADDLIGDHQDSYSWTWGDVLFVVLNPYSYASKRKADERWRLSLGDYQYHWLEKTLGESKAAYKLIFIHQLAGGLNDQGRGGIEAVQYGEWGGGNADGSDGFHEHRPGWDVPIHALLVKNHVTAVFHGHDHLYAHQQLDGIDYQEVPQPAHPGLPSPENAQAGGYKSGVIRAESGHLFISVAPSALTVSYIQSELNKDGSPGLSNNKVLESYRLAPWKY
ncbi:metallophosphoesterase family protein [Sapientia aquatica]|uniref:Calcineurin-like phosphoesterase domain-containing protein n=1 Tax=Sapientia aquatica TaxID=1549640 RepID=A0A4R5W213_9BURK|nr:metallophosphoesterase [Sapientia aquatica]TDK66373.1 hypothetical protein E2I14_07820 [Sapientia aquatica]